MQLTAKGGNMVVDFYPVKFATGEIHNRLMLKVVTFNRTMETITSQIEVTKSQADILLWCVEQMFIDLSDDEERDLEPVLNSLAEIVR